MKQIFTGKSGELENTVFCILAPDGQETLTRAGRGPHFAFRTPTAMATAMNRFAEQYPGKNDDDVPRLPQMKNFRLGLNVAECDGLPIVVCLANDSREMNKLHHKISPLAFSNELSGKFAYASVTDPKELQTLVGEKPESGFLVVAPGTYGLDGQIETTIPADVSAADLAIRLSTFAKAFQGRDKEHHDHVRTGRDSGIDWQTEIPVTDPMANAARGRDPRGMRGGPPHGRGGPPPRGGPPRGEWGPPKGPPPGKGKGKDKKRRKKEDRD